MWWNAEFENLDIKKAAPNLQIESSIFYLAKTIV